MALSCGYSIWLLFSNYLPMYRYLWVWYVVYGFWLLSWRNQIQCFRRWSKNKSYCWCLLSLIYAKIKNKVCCFAAILVFFIYGFRLPLGIFKLFILESCSCKNDRIVFKAPGQYNIISSIVQESKMTAAILSLLSSLRKVCRYQRGNQKS